MLPRLVLAVLVLSVLLVGAASPLADPQQPGADGPEFQVSSQFQPRYSYYFGFGPGAALADSGDFIVVWASTQAGGLGALAGRAFDPDAGPRGDDFMISDGALFHYFPESPDAVAGGGQFVVVWSGRDLEDYFEGEYYSVKVRRYDLLGAPLADTLQITPGFDEFLAEASAAPSGDFLVVWDFGVIRARLLDVAGGFKRPEFPAAPGTVSQTEPDAAMDALGNFVVVWEDGDATGKGGIFGRRFDASGTALSGTFEVSQFPTGSQTNPAIAAQPDGGFVVVWTSHGQDGSGSGVFGRRFDASGGPGGGEFPINTTTFRFQGSPDVAVDARGNFVVAWQSGPYYRRADLIFGQRFDHEGRRVGGEFRINEDQGSRQRWPAISMRGDGEFLVTWFDALSPPSIRGRRYCGVPEVTAPSSLTVCAGATASLEVTASGRAPFAFQWRREGEALSDRGRVKGAGGPLLRIDPAIPSDAGVYDCLVVDGCPGPQMAVSAGASLTVLPVPAR